MANSTETDIVVIGVGTCGEDLSLQLLDAGVEVVGIEANLVGGECPFWACLPSKRMIRLGNLVAEARRGDGQAGRVTTSADWALVAAQVSTEITGGWDDSYGVRRFHERGGRLIKGRGRLAGPNTIEVGGESITARRGVVLATGSRAAIPPIPGLDSVGHWTTHDVISARELPDSLIVIGGGAVGCELGQLLARFGVEVTIVEASDRPLAAEEPEASAVVSAGLAEDGVTVITGARIERVDRDGGSIVVVLTGGKPLAADRLLVATGRRVDLSDLGLDTVGLDPDARAIPVDDRMRAAEGLWAIGDVTGKAMFTHVALYQASIVGADILGRPHPAARYDAVPRVTFTDPEVGAVGMTEAAARAAGLDVETVTKNLPATFRGWLHKTGNEGVIKLVIDRPTGRLIGATTAGPSGGEMIGMLSLAVHTGLAVRELQTMIYAFPTFHGGIGEAVGAYGRGVTTVMDPGFDGPAVIDELAGS